MNDTVICSVCGRTHRRAESELYFRLPDAIHSLSDEERAERCKCTSDLWMLDGRRFFVRGLLPLPVHGRSRPYNIGIWAEVSRDVLDRIRELWTDPAQASEPRMPGTLANRLPLLADTAGLPVFIQLTGPTTRPDFYVGPAEHALYGEQTRGIDEHRTLEYTDAPSNVPAI